MSGQWPPEWDDPEDSIPETDQQDTEAEAGLSEVAAYLASVPSPLMPGSVEARISAALAVEATARAGITAPASGGPDGDKGTQTNGTAPSEGMAGARVLGPAPARARVRRRGERGRRADRDVRGVLGKFVVGPLAVCLLIVGIAFGLSRAGSSSSSSSAASGAFAPAATSAPSVAASSAAAASGDLGVSSAAASAAVPAPASTGAGTSAGFEVTESGTRYQPAALAQQARDQMVAAKARTSALAAPTAQLRACVLKVTGGQPPKLVDRATYQGTPVYVIASSNRVWVVGLGCTAASPQLITSVPLAG